MTVRPFVPFVLPGIVSALRFGPFEYLIVRGSVAKKLQKNIQTGQEGQPSLQIVLHGCWQVCLEPFSIGQSF